MTYEDPAGTPNAEFDPELEAWMDLARKSSNRDQILRLLQTALGGRSRMHRIRQPYEETTPPEPYYMNDPTDVSPAWADGADAVSGNANHLSRLLGAARGGKR